MDTDRLRDRWNRAAGFYDLMEMPLLDRFRPMVWSHAYGSILELGVGTGRNLPHYPEGSRVTAIDISPGMLARSRKRRDMLGLDVDLVEMDIQNLGFGSGSFDTVISTCVFCTVPDPVKGLMEARRVCKPDGRVIALEHVRSANRVVGGLMDSLDPLVSGMVGTHINRDTVGNFRASGLTIQRVQNLWSDILVLIIASPGINHTG